MQVNVVALVVASALMIGALIILRLPTFYVPWCAINCVPVNLEMVQVIRVSMALFFTVAFTQAYELKHHLWLQLLATIGIVTQGFDIKISRILMGVLPVELFSGQWLQLQKLYQIEMLSGFLFCLLVFGLYWASLNQAQLSKFLGPLAPIIEPKS